MKPMSSGRKVIYADLFGESGDDQCPPRLDAHAVVSKHQPNYGHTKFIKP